MPRFKPAIRIGAASLCAAIFIGVVSGDIGGPAARVLAETASQELGQGMSFPDAMAAGEEANLIAEDRESGLQAPSMAGADGDGEILSRELRAPELLIDVKDLTDYATYLEAKGDAAVNPERHVLDATDYDADAAQDVRIEEDEQGPYLHTTDTSHVAWTFEVETAGLYSVKLCYLPVEGKNADIERALSVNGEIPFKEAQYLNFSRVWTNEVRDDAAENGIRQDPRGNDVKPRQIEVPMWRETFVRDSYGYYQTPLLFYFEEGTNTLALEGVREGMGIRTIIVGEAEAVPSYEAYRRQLDEDGVTGDFTLDAPIIVQGEDAKYKSHSTLYPVSDRSSPKTVPYDASKLRLNTIGGYNWRQSGQWLTWEIDIPEDGFYNLAIKYRQHEATGLTVSRKLLVDDTLPFDACGELGFGYDRGWRYHHVGGDEPYALYLEKGTHTLTLEVVLGDELSHTLQKVDASLIRLNEIYRELLMVIGTSPDPMRDYQLAKKMPRTIRKIDEEYQELSDLAAYMKAQGSDDIAASMQPLDNIVQQLKRMADDDNMIPELWSSFKDNIVALGAWSYEMKEQPLQIDYLAVTQPHLELPRADANIFEKIAHEFSAFIASFGEDYDSIGTVHGKDAITVWFLTSGAQIAATASSGRDQGTILKGLIDNYFTPRSGVPVNLKLVDATVLLPATLSGNAPDVAINVTASEVLNYALRGAVHDISGFGDFDDVAEFFHPLAFTPFTHEGAVYALPQTMSFPVLFYRADILEELGIAVPETWDAFLVALAELQKNNMNVGVPSDPPTFGMFLYQNDGMYYEDGGMASGLDSEASIAAFNKWTSLFTNFKTPVTYDFANRFRTGEMPLAIAEYTNFSYLSVFAPEIRGLWSFTTVPGTRTEDGHIDRSVAAHETATFMLSLTEREDEAWSFMKWWMADATQSEYGLETENVLGVAGRVATANVEALANLPWSTTEFRNIESQLRDIVVIPEVPGGYFTDRHIRNAFYSVYNKHTDPRETISEYTQMINQEISNKRKEFGLPYIDYFDEGGN